MRLYPTVAHMPSEELMCFVARLAHCNGIATIREFCLDLGLSMRRLIDGDVAEVAQLAEIGGSDVDALLRESRKREGQIFRIRNQSFTNPSLMRPHFRACPLCLADDLRGIGKSAIPSSLYQRTLWSIQHIRTCVKHNVALVDICTSGGESAYNYPKVVGEWLEGNLCNLSDVTDQPSTSFELYLIHRLEESKEVSWLDHLPFYAAAKTCEVIGIVRAYGRDQNSRVLRNTQWAHAAEQGYEIVRHGPNAIEEFLIHLWKDFPGARGSPAGPIAWFGRLYHWLSYETKDPAYDPVRALIVKAIADHIPFHPNEKLFGQLVPYRKIHSIGTASHVTKISQKRLRSVLERAGHIGSEHHKQVAHDILFDASAATPLLNRLSAALTAEATSRVLGIKRDTLMLIVNSKLLIQIDTYQSATAAPLFDAADVSAFMLSLREGAELISEMPKMTTDVVSAVGRTHRSLVDILGLIVRRELDWVGWQPNNHGIRSIIVNVGQIRERLRRENLDGLTRRQVIQELSIQTKTLNRILEMQILRSVVQIHPNTRYKVTVVSQEDCRNFNLRYIKIFDTAKLLSITLVKTKRSLAAENIFPKLAKADFGMDFYLRAEVVAFAKRCK